MRSRILVLVSTLCLVARAGAAEGPGGDVPALVGEQRMLSQRLVKAYAQLGLGVAPAVASVQLADALRCFDANLGRLRGGAAGHAAEALDRLATRWDVLRTAAAAVPSRDAASALSGHSLAVLDAAAAVAAGPGQGPADSPGRPEQLAEEQRMLSQRVAKAYMLVSWGEPSRAQRRELDAAAAEFSENLRALAARPESDGAIRQELDELALQWEWLSTALAAEGAVSYRLVVAEAADSILASAERLTRLYEKLNRPANGRAEK